jgi:virginiamycin B lyase
MGRVLKAIVVASTLAGLAAAPAAALTPTVTHYPTDSALSGPNAIAAGPDGGIWFTELNGRAIGRMTVEGTQTLHTLIPGASGPYSITAGSDGAMWFVAQGPSIVGRIDSSGGILTKALANPTANPFDIASGPDGALWFTERVTPKAIGRIPASTPLATPDESRTTTNAPSYIASGPDGNLWFTDYNGQRIGRMTTAGGTNYFPVTPPTANPEDITAGPDGALWYYEDNPTDVVRIAIDGTQTPFALPAGAAPFALTAGPDGALWIASFDQIIRMTTDGSTQSFSLPAGVGATSITTGSDGNMWFNEANVGKIGRITTGPAATTTAATATGFSTATVTGTADGHAQATSFHLEYGQQGGATTNTPERSLGNITGATPVVGALTGLKPATAYQARVVVTNPTGSSAGEFKPFTTAPRSCRKRHRRHHRHAAAAKKRHKKCKKKRKKR